MAITDTTKETCGACGQTFDNLADVFDHECGEDLASARATLNRPASPMAQGPRASEKQVAFLVRLGVAQADAEAMSKSTASTMIDKLLKTQGAPKMSDKQEAFLRSLLAQKQPQTDADGVVWIINNELPSPSKGASAMIDVLKQQPNAVRPLTSDAKSTKPELVKGDVHVIEGGSGQDAFVHYYRVHMAQGTGNLYACKWDGNRFDYAKGAIKLLTPANKITAEQAAEFGHMFEQCVFCSHEIDTPESTAVGYGPICARKHGLPWG